jgi:hypothetical protein
MKLVVADLDYVLAFEHVPQLVFVLMDVEWSIEGISLFEHRERSASGIGSGSDHEVSVAESEALSAICFDFVTASLSHRGQL